MNTQTTTDNTTPLTEQIIKQVVNSWAIQNKAVTNFLNKYDADVYLHEIAPGRNRAVYLIGHLAAVNDTLLPLLGLGERLFPQWQEIFVANPDNVANRLPAIAELKQGWEKVNATLSDHFSRMSTQDWLSRHTSVSEEDFAKEPTRNKLNVLLSRTNHQSYHLGQMNLLTH